MLMEYWAEEKASKMENESIKKNYDNIKNEINIIENGPKFYKKYLLNSIDECLGKKDLESISSLH
jgi:uncharacterized protein YpiB (UPF0302 family)